MVIHFDLAGLVIAVVGGVAVIALLWVWGGVKAIWSMPQYQEEMLEEIRLMRLTLWKMFPPVEGQIKEHLKQHMQRGDGNTIRNFGKIGNNE